MSTRRESTAAAPSRDPLAPGAETLVFAARAVAAVVHAGHSADDAFEGTEGREDRSAIRAVALGTLRWYLRLLPAVARLLSRPIVESPPELAALLVVAAHQIVYSRSAAPVSVHLAVDAARGLGFGRASGFVNAVLRRFVREHTALLAEVDADRGLRTAHPPWLERELAQAWPDDLDTMLAANNEHPPMLLRVDASRGTAADYVRELASNGRPARVLEWRSEAVLLQTPSAVQALPGFRDGRVSVQDAGAQLAAPLLELAAGQRVLDACAAPGGKTLHMLELAPELGELVAVDIAERRLAMLHDGLKRSGRAGRVRCVAADLTDPAALPGLGDFDRILVDAPCSATGVIRRHPDIKLLRRVEDIAGCVADQRRILSFAFSRLRAGGRLVYATCSVLPAENDARVLEFLAATPDARLLPWPGAVSMPPGARQMQAGVQLLPGAEAGTDGFYYSCLGRAP